jgi:hypothetical protein
MAGTLVISTLSDGTNSTSTTNCVQGSAKAWVNFNGTTSPGTIRASYNVSSVTKAATGNYTMNFATAFADANYCFVFGGKDSDDPLGYPTPGLALSSTNSTTQLQLLFNYPANALNYDAAAYCVAIFR